MPLIQSKSKHAVGENIKKEQEAGRPHKQAIAIALEVQRRNKKKKMADGGEVAPEATDDQMPTTNPAPMVKAPAHPHNMHHLLHTHPMVHAIMKKMAEGGVVPEMPEDDEGMYNTNDEDDEDEEEIEDHLAMGGSVHTRPLVSSIMERLRAKHMGKK